MNKTNRRSAVQIMDQLIGLVKPLLIFMITAILLGTIGYLCAIFLTILAGQVLAHGLIPQLFFRIRNPRLVFMPVKTVLTIMIVIALLRGILHYLEQYCNHYIAFRLLAIIRHKVFEALQKLCPAKLESRDKGNLISIITTDIELLEVFYAHTISPICIAFLTSLFMVLFIGHYHYLAGSLALIAYIIVGVIIPVINGKLGSAEGMTFRNNFGELNSFVLDSLRGLDETILDDYSLKLEPGKITGIHGVSGSGKSTILKLLMRFWDVYQGSITVDEEEIKQIPTKHLRNMESYVTQETHLFHDSIANNIAIAKKDATREEIIESCKKASIHDFIMTLPKGYDTEVGELGDTLSGGEKQRIGIARAFLHDAPMILMDEPTSNLDSLNEGIILKSLKESSKQKTIVLVSHRASTMNIADTVYEMKDGRIS